VGREIVGNILVNCLIAFLHSLLGFELSKAYYVDMPKSASATIPKPKTNPQMKTIMPTGKGCKNTQQK
jgi:hypothetical protein